MSLPVLRITPSAGRPFATAWPWAEDGPYEALMLMPEPCGVFLNSAISLSSTGRGVEYATRFNVTSCLAPDADAASTAATAVEREKQRKYASMHGANPSCSSFPTGLVDYLNCIYIT